MLRRSFKPAKCKTALKLAASRIKLLRNKRGVQVSHLKRELANLLESGQEQTARIRVEHVMREEKTMAAYELIEIYCELIAARLPIIDSQKNCPIDLKEAIASVVFASPRCSDLPELMDVCKHFTAKYGKEFISSAVELRPDCGVNRMLVEKLSAVPPDGQTKIKILSAIAEEHNIKWDPTSFEDKYSKPSEDLLNGPSTSTKASEMHAEPPYTQIPPSQDVKHNETVDHNVNNARSSASFKHVASAEIDSNRMMSPVNVQSEVKSGFGSKEMESRQISSGGRNGYLVERQDVTTEYFKDAASAAQAAAESAERASMAARAAAELSSHERILKQYARELQTSSSDELQDASPGKSVSANFNDNHLHNKNPRMNEKTNRNEQDNTICMAQRLFVDDATSNTKRFSGMADSFKKTDRYGEEGNFLNEVRKERSSHSEAESQNLRKQSSTENTFVNAHAKTSDYQGYEDDARNNLYADVLDKGGFQSNIGRSESGDNPTAVFDDSSSDEDKHGFDHTRQESCIRFLSPDREYKSKFSENTKDWSPTQDELQSARNSSPYLHIPTESHYPAQFAENMMTSFATSESEELQPVTFDDSDGPSSESELEVDKSNPIVRMDKHAVSEENHEMCLGSAQSSSLSLMRELEDEEVVHSTKPLNVAQNVGFSDEEGKGINFGTLTGGFKNKGYKHPPFVRNRIPANEPSSSAKQTRKDNPISTVQSTSFEPIVQIVSPKLNKKGNSRGQILDFDSSSDDSVEPAQQPLSNNLKPSNQNVVKKQARTPVVYYDSDSEEDPLEQGLVSKSRHGSRFSRRTKATADSENSSYSDVAAVHEATEGSDCGLESEVLLRKSIATGTNPKHQSEEKSSSHQRSSKLVVDSKFSLQVGDSKQLEEKHPSDPRSRLVISRRTETVDTSSIETPPKESPKKASHVHPNLPDFDAISSHLASIRANSQ